MRVELKHVWRPYHVGDEDVVALRDAVTIEPGESVAVVGPSGSGKSTFLQLIGLPDSPSAGEVCFDSRDVGSLTDRARTRVRLESMGFVFQGFHLLNQISALENVMLPMEIAGATFEERHSRDSPFVSCWTRRPAVVQADATFRGPATASRSGAGCG